ncbi:hypothetical protein ACHAXA_004490 [Cyclostephanos tholiformis]|uniref:2Fe-2S ferredoxin-type domain-containing protein n=1 Tax=Cyclostephanos tholiformis TaxID=382380 RepID=A0ABD3RYP5_9STRA
MPRFSLISTAALSLLTALLLLGRTALAFSVYDRRSSSDVPPVVARRSSSSCSRTTHLRMTVLTSNGKKIDVPEGTPLKTACEKLGVKPKYSCKRGDCGSCTVSVGGSRIKACVGKVPPMPRLKSLQEKGLEVK